MCFIDQNPGEIALNASGFLTLDEERTAAVAACNADIGFARFTGAVDHTAHDRNLHGHTDILYARFNLCGNRGQVDARAPAGRAGHELDTVLADVQGAQNIPRSFRFGEGITGQGDTDGIADPVGQQAADADGTLDGALTGKTGLGDAHVQGIITDLM